MFQSAGCLLKEPINISATQVVNSLTMLCGNDVNGAFFDSFRNHITGAKEFFEGSATNVSGIEALDDYTVKITLGEANESFIYLLAEPACAIVHLCGNGNFVASGPFEPSIKGGKLSLRRNPSYLLNDEFGNTLPYLDRVNFVHYANKEAEIEAFFSGDLDVVISVFPDPISGILENHIGDFTGKDAKFIIQRNSELASYDLYTLIRKDIKGFSLDYQGRPDLSKVTVHR